MCTKVAYLKVAFRRLWCASPGGIIHDEFKVVLLFCVQSLQLLEPPLESVDHRSATSELEEGHSSAHHERILFFEENVVILPPAGHQHSSSPWLMPSLA